MSSILRFKTLEIQNFMSFGNSPSVFELDGQGTVCIEGINLDTGSNSSNGSGKCVCINTIVKVRNTKSGEILELTIGELYEIAKRQKGT